MNHKERYQQAFRVLTASDELTLEAVTKMKRKKFYGKNIAAACVCAVLILGVGGTVYGRQIVSVIRDWGNNMEITSYTDEDGEEVSEVMVHTEDMTEPVVFENGRMIFVVNDEHLDITDEISESEAFVYEYQDADGNTQLWLIGPQSENLADYGYAVYVKNPAGDWIGGYSARINIEADGKTSALWLENAKAEMGIPW